MEEIYCPRCKDPVGFPFMKCPACKWSAMGSQIENRKELAERYIQEDMENEAQDRMVLEMVLSEVIKRDAVEGERRIKEYKRHSWFTFKYYLISIPILIIVPYIVYILDFKRGGVPEDIGTTVFYSSMISAVLIGASTFIFLAGKIRLYFMDNKK